MKIISHKGIIKNNEIPDKWQLFKQDQILKIKIKIYKVNGKPLLWYVYNSAKSKLVKNSSCNS